MRFRLLRKFIKEQLSFAADLGNRGGPAGKHSMDTEPFSYEDYDGYDVDITSDVHDGYALTVTYNGEKISPMNVYKDYAEANHQARMLIDRHRVGAVNSGGKKKAF